ncbi:MAG: thioesterase family protein [Gammaproteobacteria bacterium]|jgi:acyl-CoA thioesterase FadM
MNLYLRLLWFWLTAGRRGAAGLLDACGLNLRVWPTDLDTNLHMNNGRYLTLMDLGRMDLILRTGLFREMRRRRWYPVVAAIDIRYLRPLAPWQRYTLRTRVLCWDEAWVFLEQRFESRGKPMAQAVVKGQFRRGRERVETRKLLEAVGWQNPSPPMPEAVAAWVEGHPHRT